MNRFNYDDYENSHSAFGSRPPVNRVSGDKSSKFDDIDWESKRVEWHDGIDTRKSSKSSSSGDVGEIVSGNEVSKSNGTDKSLGHKDTTTKRTTTNTKSAIKNKPPVSKAPKSPGSNRIASDGAEVTRNKVSSKQPETISHSDFRESKSNSNTKHCSADNKNAGCKTTDSNTKTHKTADSHKAATGDKSYSQQKRDQMNYRAEYFKHNPGLFGCVWKCAYCGRLILFEQNVQVDHIMPLNNVLGQNRRYNLVAACPSCNRDKSDKVDARVAVGYFSKLVDTGVFSIQKLILFIFVLLWNAILFLIKFFLRAVTAPFRSEATWVTKIIIGIIYLIIVMLIISLV